MANQVAKIVFDWKVYKQRVAKHNFHSFIHTPKEPRKLDTLEEGLRVETLTSEKFHYIIKHDEASKNISVGVRCGRVVLHQAYGSEIVGTEE